VDQQKIETIYKRLSELSIDLPRGSSDMGPDFLREAISVCRNFLNEASHYLQDLLVEESFLAMRLDSEESTYQIRSTELLATDPRVSSRPNIADRQAAIDNILREQKQSIIRLQSEIRSLGHVKTVVRARQTELNNTMSSIRLQRSLLKDALRTGSFYGDETTASRGHGGLDPIDELTPTDLEALVAASEAELEEEAASKSIAPLEAVDPVDQLDSNALEALVQVVPVEQPPPAEETKLEEKEQADETEEDLHAALEKFLEEPDEDIASILENI
jgi:hypothetical protein